MTKNYDKKTGKYRFVKVNGVDPLKFTTEDVSMPVFLDKESVSRMTHIKENLYELDGDYYTPSNYGFFKHLFNG